MTKGRRIAGFALLTGVAIGLTFYITRPREPVYQGRALSEWLAELNSLDTDKQYRADEAVRQLGIKAVPQIRRMLRVEDSAAKEWINGFLGKQSAIKFRFKTASDARTTALLACVALGPAAKEALPEVKHLFLDIEPSNQNVSRALAAIGPESVPILLKALKDTNWCVRRNAALALATLDQDPQTWMPVIQEMLRQSGSGEPHFTIFDLGELGSKAKPTIPILLTALEVKDPAVRSQAAKALKKIDPEAAAKAGVK